MYGSRCLPPLVIWAGCLPALLPDAASGAPGQGGRSDLATKGVRGIAGAIVTGEVTLDVVGGTGGKGGGSQGHFEGGDRGQNGGGSGGLGGQGSYFVPQHNGGGGGGGGEALGFSGSVIIRENVTIQGGLGGEGGDAGEQGSQRRDGVGRPGFGGDGGDAISGSGELRIDGSVVGGTGGKGGVGLHGAPGGSGGNGIAASDATLVISRTASVQGGDQGEPGDSVGGLDGDTGKKGGHAIEGSNLNIRNLGVIRGGRGSDGGANKGGHGIVGVDLVVENAGRIVRGHTRRGFDGDAIHFSGGTNRLHLYSDTGGAGISGAVVGGGVSTLVLDGVMTAGGSTTATFDVSNIGLREQFRRFDYFEKRGSSTWRLTGSGSQAWTVQEGTLIGDSQSLQGDIVNEGGVVFDQSSPGSYAGSLSGAGVLEKTGAAALTLSGDVSGFTGQTLVSGGLLVVGDRADFKLRGRISVAEGGRIGGLSTLSDTFVDGVHAPGRDAQGDGIGSQRVGGDYINHGMLSINASPERLGQVVVAGQVDITGSTLELVPVTQTGWAVENGPFVIIENLNTGAVTGTFSEVTESALFLDAHVEYAAGDGNDVTVALKRNGVAFEDQALTENHARVAASIEMLGEAHPLWQSVVSTSDLPTLHSGLESLSGALYGSVQSALVDNSHFVRAAASNRLRAALGAAGEAQSPEAPADFWSTGYGAWSETNGSSNAAAVDQSAGGLFLGADASLGDWLVGLEAGYGLASVDDGAASATSRSRDFHLGTYAGGQLGAVTIRGGLAYTWHQIDASRDVSVNGFKDDLAANYDARTLQVFGEVGYQVRTPDVTFEPFVTLAHVRHDAEAFSESGEAAALNVAGQSLNTTFTTLGLRAETEIDVSTTNVTAHATVGWQHAFGDTTPVSENAFFGSPGFSIAGSALAKDSLLLEAGVDIMLSDRAALDFSYQGQLASGHQQHGLSGMIRMQF